MNDGFGRWLAEQTDRRGAVGDLARDYVTPCQCEDERAETADGIARHMAEHDACLEAWDALIKAFTEWTETMR